MRREHPPLAVSEEVATALHAGAPVVALESNVITHGLAFPDNIDAARKVEAAVRSSGAVPATVAIDAGRLLVGLGDEEVERFATTPGIPKVSSRDMAAVLACGGPGATTVASSVVIAELAGITFFASAGIGGVHRGGERSMDVSADLVQFTRSRVAVVCAGAKKILDLGRTLEFLETHCVPVVAYRSADFPAFYCTSSGHRSPQRIDDPAVLAQAVDLHRAMGHPGAFLITTPPREADSIDPDLVEDAIRDAVAAADRDGVHGSAVTTFVMRAVDRATGGRSARANAAVLASTAEDAGVLAVAHARVRTEGDR